MAYDPDARQTSNNAMIIGVVALVLVVLGALAYYATRPGETPATTVVTQPTERIIEKTTEVPVTSGEPNTVIVTPPAAAPAPATRTIERNTTTVVTPGAAAPAPAPAPRGDTNVTVNTPPAAAPAGDSASSNTATGTSGTANSSGY